MDIYALLIIIHIFGSILGVGGATFIEIFLNKSLRDGKIDPVESSFLKTTFTVVRWGLIISFFSGFGFLLLSKFNNQAFWLYNLNLWEKFSIFSFIGS